MIKTGYTFACLMAAAMSATPAVAGPAYSPDEIVAFFMKNADLGASRGLCVGTPTECQTPKAPARGFDMLVSFNLDSAVLTDAARVNVEQFATALKDQRLGAATFRVEGYTDASGSDAHNLRLSQARAESVRDFLVNQGVSPNKLQVIGLGEADPRTADPFNAENRRVEMKMSVQ